MMTDEQVCDALRALRGQIDGLMLLFGRGMTDEPLMITPWHGYCLLRPVSEGLADLEHGLIAREQKGEE